MATSFWTPIREPSMATGELEILKVALERAVDGLIGEDPPR